MDKQLIKVAIVGNVDDGKSTFVGKLLHQTNSLYDDQISHLKKISNNDVVDFSLVTDGLKNERARKVTIDAAYRYFSTDSKRVVLIDCPGHFEYLKNMITGVSQADLAIVMVDITKGIQELTKTHLKMASKLGPQETVIAINKMDQVDYDQNQFEKIKKEVLKLCNAKVIPISGLEGENINSRSLKMSWAATPLLSLINDFELPQSNTKTAVVYPRIDTYHYLQKQTGEIKVGDKLNLYPQKQTTIVKKLMSYDRDGADVVEFEQNLDFNSPVIMTNSNSGQVCENLSIWGVWISEKEKYEPNKSYTLKSLVNETKCLVNTEVENIDCYDSFQAKLELKDASYFETFKNSRECGSFILMSENQVVFAGVVEGLL